MKKALALLLMVSGACAQADQQQPAETAEVSDPGTMSVVSTGLTLDGPEEVASGWITIRFSNESPMTHFVAVERLPDGQGIATQQEQVAPVFQDGMDLLAEGDVDAALARFGDLPPWFGEIVFVGGPGLTAPGRTSEVTVFLEPGTYLLECYVKTGGVFHSYNPDPAIYGMVHEFVVTDEQSGVEEPEASVQLSISSTEGIRVEGDVRAGEQTVAVHFVDQAVHENFVGHDVHVVGIGNDLDLTSLEAWMDWRAPGGLQTPAPAPFLGGINEMPAGTTGYFSVTLEPGRYAWISEVPGTSEKGMFREFTIQ